MMAALSVVMIMSTCKKEDKKTDNCTELANKVTAAADAFSANMSEATCEAYFEAIEDYYDGCALIPPAQKALYDDILESWDCSGF